MPSTVTPRASHGHVEDALVLVLSGPIRFVTAQALRRYVDELLASESDGVLVDLRGVTVIDSTGMGLLARIGRAAMNRGRRAALVCPPNDVAVTLRSAAFDELFVMVDAYPFEEEPTSLTEVPLDALQGSASDLDLGRIILDAHRDLAGVSERNVEAYREVIAALEADLASAARPAS